jgi:hypothetical protein
MAEIDVVLVCSSVGYITQGVTRRIAGARTNHRLPQHGLLASAPIINAPDNIQGDLSSTAQATSTGSGLDVPCTFPIQTTEAYEWTGSLSDLYHPSEGSIDFDRLLRSHHANPWETANIDDPQSLDTLIENGGMHDGFLVPSGMWKPSNLVYLLTAVVPDHPESF